ncbi:multiple sugar transport system ATP-binding protein [Devosia crocina]|uniref:Multiple sugar transport system ATP-binding protein n=1 Tax=Devosia crocina TaxID=429728 RepID=A0A1I7NVL4_9HYPH|nr:sn-glycerol-3-phosphate ABC transporter ATP-binding protein UgpC [Devosia crocina]SFV38682.1 multiple sugar transport system ATP-binding protein [Devosia crocina]
MATVTLANISKRFGETAVLDNISLSIDDKSFVVFVGPSGCGKSTLLRIIAGLDAPSDGKLLIGEKDVTLEEPVDRGIAMVFQSYALYPHMSVYENIAYPLRTAGLSPGDIDRKVREAANSLQLADHLERRPSQLSGGQRQRVAIGRSIVRDPSVFLFDEPLSNLDAALRSEMRGELMRLRRKLDTTMIYVTHDQVEAMTMADQIVVLNKGRIEQVGSPMELYERPATRFVAGFIGQPGMNFLPVDRVERREHQTHVVFPSGYRMIVPGVVTTDMADAIAELGSRPEHTRLVPSGDGVPFELDYVERLGGSTLLHGHVEGRAVCVATEGREYASDVGKENPGLKFVDPCFFSESGLNLSVG